MSAFKNEFRLRFIMTFNGLLDHELNGEGVYNFSKFMMISHEIMELKASAKLAGISAGLLSDFTRLAKHYNPNGDRPLKLPAEYCQRVKRLIDSVDKILAEGRITDMELAACAIKIGEILEKHEVEHGMLPEQRAERDAAAETLRPAAVPSWIPDDVLMQALPANVANKMPVDAFKTEGW